MGRAALQIVLIAQRSILCAVRPPYRLCAWLVLPLLVLWLLCQLFGGLPGAYRSFPTTTYLAFVSPAVCVLGALPAALSLGAGLVAERQSGVLDHLLSTPLHRAALVLGETLAVSGGTLIICLSTLVASLIGGLTVAGGFAAAPALLALGVTVSLVYSGCSFLLTTVLHDGRAVTLAGSALLIGSILCSETLLPASLLPGWLTVIAWANPFTYALRGARAVIWAPPAWATLTHNLLIMVVMAIASMGLAVLSFSQRRGE